MVEWLRPYVKEKCIYCGSDMVEHVNEYGKITNRYCSNIATCPGHNAAKGKLMMDYLKIENVGFARCIEIINTYGLTSHLDLLAYFPRQKAEISTILKCLCLEGIDSKWDKECSKCNVYRIEDLKKLPIELYGALTMHYEEVEKAFLYIDVDESKAALNLSDNYQTIMITGPVMGFNTKEDYIDYLNKRFGKYINTIHQTSKRKSGINALIKEERSSTTQKVATAKEAGIPIYTSQDFIELMHLVYEDGSPEALQKARQIKVWN